MRPSKIPTPALRLPQYRRAHVIPIAVVAAWLSSRLFVDLILVSGSLRNGLPLQQVFSAWDGNWFLGIARHGYNSAPVILRSVGDGLALAQTPYPFFPLLPLLLAGMSRLGLNDVAAGVLLNHLAMLGGLALVHALTGRLSGAAAANWACWFLAFSPGSLAYSMLYTEGLLLLFSCGAFLAAERQRYGLAASLAGLATLTRPNGLVVSLALAGAACRSTSGWRQGLLLLAPSLLVLALWSAVLMTISGDPLIWMKAKQGWQEMTLLNMHTSVGGFPWTQLASGLVALALLLLGWSAQPLSWRFFGMLWIVPSFLLGMVGFPRYAGSCFPVFASLGERVSRAGTALRWLLLGGSALLLAGQTLQVGILHRWTP